MSGNRMLTQYNNQPSNLQFNNFFARWGVPKVLFPDNDSLCSSTSTFSKYLLGTSTLFSNFPVPIILKPILKRKMLIKIAKNNLKQRYIFRALIIHTSRQYRIKPLNMGQRIRTGFVALEKALCPRWPDSDIFRSYIEETKESYQF